MLPTSATPFQTHEFHVGELHHWFSLHTPPSFVWRQTSQLEFIGTADPSMPNEFALVSFQKIMNSASYSQTTLEASCISKINKQLTCQKHITSFITITQPWRGDMFSVVPMTTDLREVVICDQDNKNNMPYHIKFTIVWKVTQLSLTGIEFKFRVFWDLVHWSTGPLVH
jgi:hypothetical protein